MEQDLITLLKTAEFLGKAKALKLTVAQKLLEVRLKNQTAEFLEKYGNLPKVS